jgi:two-component system response regulator MprA
MASPPRVLVADDDPELLATVAEELSRLGFVVTSACSGADLVDQLVSEGPFDLIVSDVSMPWMDGLKALRSIRTTGLATPIIVMTALTDQGIPDLVRALGPRAILLRKPFALAELDAAVTTLVRPAQPTADRAM